MRPRAEQHGAPTRDREATELAAREEAGVAQLVHHEVAEVEVLEHLGAGAAHPDRLLRGRAEVVEEDAVVPRVLGELVDRRRQPQHRAEGERGAHPAERAPRSSGRRRPSSTSTTAASPPNPRHRAR